MKIQLAIICWGAVCIFYQRVRFEETSPPSFFVSSSLSRLNEGTCERGCEVVQPSANMCHTGHLTWELKLTSISFICLTEAQREIHCDLVAWLECFSLLILTIFFLVSLSPLSIFFPLITLGSNILLFSLSISTALPSSLPSHFNQFFSLCMSLS